VADPVFQLRTPSALNVLWAERSVDMFTVPARVAPGDLHSFMQGLRANASAAGAVVSVPHKTDVAEQCDMLGPNARVVGAVNVVRRASDGTLTGETFDGLGFVAGLRSRGIDPVGQRVVICGAGGAASALAVALLAADVAALDVYNRTEARAQALVDRLTEAFPGTDLGVGLSRLPEASLIVNATSNGMKPEDAPTLRGEMLPRGALAAEIVMTSLPTAFLAGAAARGLEIHEGIHMLHGQLSLIADYLGSDG
jgi:shikimate dehydrogenase